MSDKAQAEGRNPYFEGLFHGEEQADADARRGLAAERDALRAELADLKAHIATSVAAEIHAYLEKVRKQKPIGYIATSAATWLREREGQPHAWKEVRTYVSPPDMFESEPLYATSAQPAPAQPTEIRADGMSVRIDRWETGIRNIVALLWGNRREFEISDVVEAVRKLAPVAHAEDEALFQSIMSGSYAAIGQAQAQAEPAAQPVQAAPVSAEDALVKAARDALNAWEYDSHECEWHMRALRAALAAKGAA
jgi:hypothetical protein